MLKKMHKTGYMVAAAVFMATVMTSCVADESGLEDKVQDTREAIKVVAHRAEALITRAEDDDDPWIKTGTYYFSYPKPDNNYNVASVNFSELGNGVGLITVPPSSELRWLSVGGGSTPIFYLDNVRPELNMDADSTKVVFGEDNPFRAGRYEGDLGRNDLLWGEKMEARNTGTINFDLHHYMSRVRVEVTVDNSEIRTEDQIQLEGAKVEITSINQVPISFNRLDGILELDTDPENTSTNYTTLTLVSPDDSELGWFSSDEKDDGNILTYTTQDFVVPPQDLLETTERSRLQITLQDGRIYSGIIPNAMLIKGPGTGGLDYPVVLSFLKEYILTIRTEITQEPPSLSFMPVYVVQWVDKGVFDLEAHQAGIYTPEEFYNLTAYYTSGNAYQLERYGTLDTSDEDGEKYWNFVFFHSVSLDFDKIKGKMIPGTDGMEDFRFSFTNYRISVYRNGDPEDAVSVTPEKLKEIVSNSNASFPSN